jgi:hypothetical protein
LSVHFSHTESFCDKLKQSLKNQRYEYTKKTKCSLSLHRKLLQEPDGRRIASSYGW